MNDSEYGDAKKHVA